MFVFIQCIFVPENYESIDNTFHSFTMQLEYLLHMKQQHFLSVKLQHFICTIITYY